MPADDRQSGDKRARQPMVHALRDGRCRDTVRSYRFAIVSNAPAAGAPSSPRRSVFPCETGQTARRPSSSVGLTHGPRDALNVSLNNMKALSWRNVHAFRSARHRHSQAGASSRMRTARFMRPLSRINLAARETPDFPSVLRLAFGRLLLASVALPKQSRPRWQRPTTVGHNPNAVCYRGNHGVRVR